jgi:Na+/melibiose symporter-like transporter
MDISQFPITPEMAYTVTGAAVICLVLTQLLKQYLGDWRYTNLLAIGVTLVIVELAGAFFVDGAPLGERLFSGFLIALASAAAATLGYETVANLIGAAGRGPRADT